MIGNLHNVKTDNCCFLRPTLSLQVYLKRQFLNINICRFIIAVSVNIYEKNIAWTSKPVIYIIKGDMFVCLSVCSVWPAKRPGRSRRNLTHALMSTQGVFLARSMSRSFTFNFSYVWLEIAYPRPLFGGLWAFDTPNNFLSSKPLKDTLLDESESFEL